MDLLAPESRIPGQFGLEESFLGLLQPEQKPSEEWNVPYLCDE